MWKHAGRRHYLTEKAKRYYWDVAQHVRAQNAVLKLECPIGVQVSIFPPDKRRRDLDNIWKIVGDALTRSGLWVDDSIIERFILQRMPVDKTPRIEILVQSVAKIA